MIYIPFARDKYLEPQAFNLSKELIYFPIRITKFNFSLRFPRDYCILYSNFYEQPFS